MRPCCIDIDMSLMYTPVMLLLEFSVGTGVYIKLMSISIQLMNIWRNASESIKILDWVFGFISKCLLRVIANYYNTVPSHT